MGRHAPSRGSSQGIDFTGSLEAARDRLRHGDRGGRDIHEFLLRRAARAAARMRRGAERHRLAEAAAHPPRRRLSPQRQDLMDGRRHRLDFKSQRHHRLPRRRCRTGDQWTTRLLAANRRYRWRPTGWHLGRLLRRPARCEAHRASCGGSHRLPRGVRAGGRIAARGQSRDRGGPRSGRPRIRAADRYARGRVSAHSDP